MLFHGANHVDEFGLVARLSPPQGRSRPVGVDRQVDKRNRPRPSACAGECGSVQQRSVMAVKQSPVLNATRSAGAFERWGEFRTRLAAVTVAELMKGSAMIIKNAVIGMNEREERVALEKFRSLPIACFGIIIGDPTAAVRVVIEGHGVHF